MGYIVRLKKNNKIIDILMKITELIVVIDILLRLGKEIGFEVSKLILNFGVKIWNFQKFAFSHIEDYGSIRILEKLNFKKRYAYYQ